MQLDSAEDFQEVHGKGVLARVGGDLCRIGRVKWMTEQGIAIPEHEVSEQDGMSVVYVARGEQLLGWIGFKDKLRPDGYNMIDRWSGGWDPSGGAIYYYNPDKTSNAWIRTRPVIKRIGQHLFCS